MTRERILLVEHERTQRIALARFLEQLGTYEVEAVETGEEAIERLREQRYVALVTDLRLPGIDGLEVIRRARAIDDELALLLTAASASVDSVVDALRLGAHDFLLKPLMLEEVARRLEQLLAHRRPLRGALQEAGGDPEPPSWALKTAVDRFERAHIMRVLQLCDGNREKAAEALGLSLATLYRRLDKLDLKGVEVHRGGKREDDE